jgi:hypothetical protein
MIRLPVHGFAKRVEDAVARGMTFLRARDQIAAAKYRPTLAPKSKEQPGTAASEGVSS